MRIFFLYLLIGLFSSAILDAAPNNRGVLRGKVIIENQRGYFMLSDGSFWHVFGLTPRARSWSEWWRGIHPSISKNCACHPEDWVLNCPIETYLKEDVLDVNLSDVSNLTKVDQATHCLVNPENGQLLFCNPILPEECMRRIQCESAEIARDQGSKEGAKSVGLYATEAYRRGYSDGFSAGRHQHH